MSASPGQVPSASSAVHPHPDLGVAVKHAVVNGDIAEVEKLAAKLLDVCRSSKAFAIYSAVEATLAVAGLPGSMNRQTLDNGPKDFFAQLPEWVQKVEMTAAPLLHSAKHQGRCAVACWQKFWICSIGAMPPEELVDHKLDQDLAMWLLPMSNCGVRPLRHAATVAVLSIATALHSHCEKLENLCETFAKQLQGMSLGSKHAQNSAQVGALRKEAESTRLKADYVARACSDFRDGTVPQRKGDVCEIIRMFVLGELQEIMNEGMKQPNWVAFPFLMLCDPCSEIRLKAVVTLQRWYGNLDKKSDVEKEHLRDLLNKCICYIVERTKDVDTRVAAAAMKCLRLPVMASTLKDADFEAVVGMIWGSPHLDIRVEAAYFVNSHVFHEPGILQATASRRRRAGRAGRPRSGENEMDGSDKEGEGEQQAGMEIDQDHVQAVCNSETAMSMLIEYLENYMVENLRLTDRVVGAFWGKAPCLLHWTTMLNLLMVGEGDIAGNTGLAPISAKQRLIVLYVLEASVRHCDDERQKSTAAAVRRNAALSLSDACRAIIPELARLFEICRSDEQQMLLISHVCKMLVEYAKHNADQKVMILHIPLIQELRSGILQQSSQVTVMHCLDAMLALVAAFQEARHEFIALANMLCRNCTRLMRSILENHEARMLDLKDLLMKVVVVSARGTDISFGNSWMLNRFIELIFRRSVWLQNVREQCVFKPSPVDSTPIIFEGAQKDWNSQPPPGVPDVEVMVNLIETATYTMMWYLFELKLARESGVQMVSSMLDDTERINELRNGLHRLLLDFKDALADLAGNARESPCIRFCAFCCFLHISTAACAYTVQETGATYTQNWALWRYLSSLLEECCKEPGRGLMHVAGGQPVAVSGVNPPPSQDTFTYPRFLFQSWVLTWRKDLSRADFVVPAFGVAHSWGSVVRSSVNALQSVPREVQTAAGQTADLAPEKTVKQEVENIKAEASEVPRRQESDDFEQEHRQICAVIACQMVLQTNLEDIYTGPLGHLVLMQCERNKPRVFQELAILFLKRLRDRANPENCCARQYFEIQMEIICGMFSSSGAVAALDMSLAFTQHWRARAESWFEKALVEVLTRVISKCFESLENLPLLEAFYAWMRQDFLSPESCRKIGQHMTTKCEEVSRGVAEAEIARILSKAKHIASLGAETTATVSDRRLSLTPLANMDKTCRKRITGKRSAPDGFLTPSRKEQVLEERRPRWATGLLNNL